MVGFLASRLLYEWINRAGLQSAGFSPTVASTLTAPLLACVYYALLVGLSPAYYGIWPLLVKAFAVLVLCAPIILPLSPLLVIYLCGGFRTKKIFGVIVCALAVCFVTAEFIGLYLLASHLE